LGLSSAMLVPLLAHGRTYGVITFITAESGRRYNAQDLILAQDPARRAAVAVENARLYQAAQNANRLKDEFLATVSHELRTPLTAILGWSRMLESGTLATDMADRAIETISRNARSQAQIIDDILDVSRIITGKLYLELLPIEIARVLEAAINVFPRTAEATAINIEVDFEPEPTAVPGDSNRL